MISKFVTDGGVVSLDKVAQVQKAGSEGLAASINIGLKTYDIGYQSGNAICHHETVKIARSHRRDGFITLKESRCASMRPQSQAGIGDSRWPVRPFPERATMTGDLRLDGVDVDEFADHVGM